MFTTINWKKKTFFNRENTILAPAFISWCKTIKRERIWRFAAHRAFIATYKTNRENTERKIFRSSEYFFNNPPPPLARIVRVERDFLAFVFLIRKYVNPSQPDKVGGGRPGGGRPFRVCSTRPSFARSISAVVLNYLLDIVAARARSANVMNRILAVKPKSCIIELWL